MNEDKLPEILINLHGKHETAKETQETEHWEQERQ
jgi:hypothetical protein